MDRDPPARYGDALAAVVVTVPGGPDADDALRSVHTATTRAVHLSVVHSGWSAPRGGATEPLVTGSLVIGEDAGRGAAVNRAVAGLPSEVGWVAVADPDVRWGVGAVDALLAVVALFPRAGILAPGHRGGTGRLSGVGGALPGAADLLRGRLPDHAPASPGPVGWVSGRAMVLRRSAWDSVDGYDPRHLGRWGDVDLCERLGRSGWQVVHVPTVEVEVRRSPAVRLLEPSDRGVSRYAGDRFGGAARAAVRASGWLRGHVRGTGATNAAPWTTASADVHVQARMTNEE